jgi:hypothetical protein
MQWEAGDIELFLPKYLSETSIDAIKEALKDFERSRSEPFYTSHLADTDTVYQGDGLRELPIIRLPDTDVKQRNCMVVSNTCDIDPNNSRSMPARLLYAPIQSLDNYRAMVKSHTSKTDQQIESQVVDIQRQQITSLFYLPPYGDHLPPSVVHLDWIHNISNVAVDRQRLSGRRIFTLSNFGAYLFVLKLSIHFSRIQDQVDRGAP